MRFAKPLLIFLLILVAVVVLAVRFLGGAAIKQAVNTGGPLLLGVPVRLESATFQPFSGRLVLGNLFVGNPEGFSPEGLLRLQSLEIDWDARSLLTDTVRVRRIVMRAPEIRIEKGLDSNNIRRLLENLEKRASERPPSPPPSQPQAEPPQAERGKRLTIDEVILEGGRLHVATPAVRGSLAAVKLPTITIRDLGGGDGISVIEAIAIVARALLDASVHTASKLGGGLFEVLIGASDQAASTGADESQHPEKRNAAAVLQNLGNLLKKDEKAAE